MKITHTKKKTAVYENRILAFVDILGFKTLVEDSRGDTELRRKLLTAMKYVRATANNDLEDSVRQVTTFSDSAVISYKADERDSLFYLLLDIIHLQLDLGGLGIMMRGGIAIGECYHDGNIVFGPVMNEAYRLESTVAKWPRVVITEETLGEGIKLSTDKSKYGFKYDYDDIIGCVKKSSDITISGSKAAGKSGKKGKKKKKPEDEPEDEGLYFIDFLTQSQEVIDFGDEYFIWLKKFRTALVNGLNRYNIRNPDLEISKADADRVFKKYRWLLNYWNSVVDNDEMAMPAPDIGEENQMKFRDNYKKLKIRKLYPYV